MPRPSRLSISLEAAVRAHFGLQQAELARYLGVSKQLVGHIEAGRRLPTRALGKRLHWLADLLPAPEGQGPAAPDFAALPLPTAPVAALLAALPDFGPLPDKPLQQRQRLAAAQAAALRLALHQAGKRQARQRRRQWGLSVLQAAPPPVFVDAAGQAHFTRWLQVLATDVAAEATTSPASDAAQALALLRLLMLEVEAAILQLLRDQE